MVLLERAGFAGIPIRSLSFRLGIHAKKIREALEKLLSIHQAILLSSDDTTVLSVHLYAQLEELILKSLTNYHRKNPLKEGVSKEELKAALPSTVPVKLFNMVLVSLGKKGGIVINKDNARLATHQVLLAGEEDALHQSIAVTYVKAGLTPPSLSDVLNSFQDRKAKAQNIIKLMLKDGELIKINEDLCFARTVMEKLREDYKAKLHRDGQATPATFKELTGLSRKYIIPLMEYFDTSKLTVRVGDHRVLREKL
jgi:selenocysteine-specific elongation factor